MSLLLTVLVASAISPPEAEPAPAGWEAPASESAPTEPAPIEPEPIEPEPIEPEPIEPDAVTPEPAPIWSEPDESEAEPEPAPAPVVSNSDRPPSGPPGGYWNVAEAHERETEPHDGEEQLTIGSVLLSLGLLRAGAGVISIWMADKPEQCPSKLPGGCSGLRVFGWAGVAEGGLMFATGITTLAIGLVRRERHRRWARGESLSLMRPSDAIEVVDVGPWLIPRATGFSDAPAVSGAGLRLQLQF